MIGPSNSTVCLMNIEDTLLHAFVVLKKELISGFAFKTMREKNIYTWVLRLCHLMQLQWSHRQPSPFTPDDKLHFLYFSKSVSSTHTQNVWAF